MIKFEFTLDDDEAERFLDLFQDKKCDMLERIMDLEHILPKTDSNLGELKWQKGHLEWLMGIKNKVLDGQKRIED